MVQHNERNAVTYVEVIDAMPAAMPLPEAATPAFFCTPTARPAAYTGVKRQN